MRIPLIILVFVFVLFITGATVAYSVGPPVVEGGQVGPQQENANRSPLTFTPNVPIPGLFEGTITVNEDLFGKYISSFYIFFAGIAGILAVVVMMWGGFHYLTSAGNPQRMKLGKEIIANAMIGLILVLTSYLLLNLINPRLTKLRVPTLAYVPQILQPSLYCEAQGAIAIAAAKKQNARCGAEVKYKNESGREVTCISLALDAKEQADQKVCYPSLGDDPKIGVEYKRDKTAKSVCEKDTDVSRCVSAQRIFMLQDVWHGGWLTGACRKANIVTGGDDCKYKSFLLISTAENTGRQRIVCNYGGNTRNTNTPCWRDGQPFVLRVEDGGTTYRAACTDNTVVDVEPPIELVTTICGWTTAKNLIHCRSECSNAQLAVECNTYNPQPGKFKGGEKTCEAPKKCCADVFLTPVSMFPPGV